MICVWKAAVTAALLAVSFQSSVWAQSDSDNDGSAAQPTKSVNTGRAAISAFYDLCAAPFPDKTDFLNGMANNGYGFTPTPTPKLPHRWASGSADLVYADEEMAAATGQPAPQCVLDAVIAKGEDHLALARRLESVLLIDDGASAGRGGVNRTSWNYYDDAGNQLRVFFQTKPSHSNLLARLILLRVASAGERGSEETQPEADDNAPQPGVIEQNPNLENEVSL